MWEIFVEGGIKIGEAIWEAVKAGRAGHEQARAWWETKALELRASEKAACLADGDNATVDAERKAGASGIGASVQGLITVDKAAFRAKVDELLVEFRRAFGLPTA